MRLAWYFMGEGSGQTTYLAGGATIDIVADEQAMDITEPEDLDLSAGQTGIDIATEHTELDLNDEDDTIDIQR